MIGLSEEQKERKLVIEYLWHLGNDTKTLVELLENRRVPKEQTQSKKRTLRESRKIIDAISLIVKYLKGKQEQT